MNCYPFIDAEVLKEEQDPDEDRNPPRQRGRTPLPITSRPGAKAKRLPEDVAEPTGRIQAVHDESRGRYGAPRVHAELRRRGCRHGRKRVARLMRAAGIAGKTPRRWRKTTIPDPAAAARADRLRRDFTADAGEINARWCGDITYIGTREGWLYLATVIDVASRRVVGFVIADHLRTELVSAALANAIAARDPEPGVDLPRRLCDEFGGAQSSR